MKKMELISEESKDQYSGKFGNKQNKLPSIKKEAPIANMSPIHQFKSCGFQSAFK